MYICVCEWPAIPLLIATYIMKKQYFMKDRSGFVDKELYEVTLKYYIIALHSITGKFTRDVPIIGSAIGNDLYRLVFSNRLSDRLVYEISSRSDIIGGQ